jgi:hypothetical protein
LSNLKGGDDSSNQISDKILSDAYETIMKFPSSSSTASSSVFSSLTSLFSEGNNLPEFKLTYDKSLSNEEYKALEEKKNKDYFIYDENYLKELFDIIIIIRKDETSLDDLEEWKPMLQELHCIILQQGDSSRQITIPSWLEYELYTKKDMHSSLFTAGVSSTDIDSLFDFDGEDLDSLTVLNFAFLVSDRDFIYFLNRNMKPIFTSDSSASSDPTLLLRIHALNLLKPSISPSYYNNDQNPYQEGKDFIKGFPYSLKEGIESVISYGSVSEDDGRNYDLITRLLKFLSSKASSDGVLKRRMLRKKSVTDEQQKTLLQSLSKISSSVLANKQYLSLSFDNLAINRKIIGPIFLMLSGATNKKTSSFSVGNGYSHILLGWLLKSVLDSHGYGIKHFLSSPYLSDRKSTPEKTKEQVIQGLKEDLSWFQINEEIFRLVSSTSFILKNGNDTASTDPRVSLSQLLEALSSSSSSVVSSLSKDITALYNQYFNLWNLRHDQKTSFLPISSKSTFSPSSSSSHQCAVYTITYNDPEFLNIWIRYFTTQFPSQDVFVLSHHSSAVSDPSRVKKYEEFIEKSVPSKFPGVRIIDLYGEKTGFPMYFFIKTADIFQRRLFRYGYKCVILTDVDELIIADPETYPQGLKQYLTSFVADSTKTATRAHGFILGQVSSVIPTNSLAAIPKKQQERLLDKPLRWDLPLFEQRNYWAVQPKYSKPILSKIPARHYPGFHNLYYPKPVKLDNKLILLHLRDMDLEFCKQREHSKAMIAQNTSFQSELNKGLSFHLSHYQEKLAKGEVCQYSLCKYFMNNQTVYDNTMEFVMSRIPPRYKKVII